MGTDASGGYAADMSRPRGSKNAIGSRAGLPLPNLPMPWRVLWNALAPVRSVCAHRLRVKKDYVLTREQRDAKNAYQRDYRAAARKAALTGRAA